MGLLGMLLRSAILALALGLVVATPSVADFTEFEDQPFLNPGDPEADDLSDPVPVPYDGSGFLTAYPDGVKLVRGHLDADDIDAYEVFLASDDLLLAALFASDSGSGTDLALGLTSGGVLPLLALDDDDGRGFLARFGYKATGPGALQVAVTGFGDAAFDGTHGEAPYALADYQLVLAVADDPPALQESDLQGPQGSNDTLLTADVLPASGALLGASLAANDVDYFAIDMEEGDRLFALVSDLQDGSFDVAEGGFNDAVLALFDPLGALVASTLDDDSHQGFLASLSYVVPSGEGGRWTLAVSGFGDSAFDGSHAEGPFDYLLVAARDRACPNVTPLMSGLIVESGKAYEIANLEAGDHYYIDRTNVQSHVLVDIPETLECSEWIKTANGDKNWDEDPLITFTLSAPAAVFIAYDTRATAEPDWLADGFTPQALVMDVRDNPNETQEFDILWRHFPAGTVELGRNEAPGASSNYVVAAQPLAEIPPEFVQEIPAGLGSGSASVTILGVVTTVAVLASDTPASVAGKLAAAIDADPAQQANRVFGLASGSALHSTAAISNFEFIAAVPSVGPAARLLLILAVGGFAMLRKRR